MDGAWLADWPGGPARRANRRVSTDRQGEAPASHTCGGFARCRGKSETSRTAGRRAARGGPPGPRPAPTSRSRSCCPRRPGAGPTRAATRARVLGSPCSGRRARIAVLGSPCSDRRARIAVLGSPTGRGLAHGVGPGGRTARPVVWMAHTRRSSDHYVPSTPQTSAAGGSGWRPEWSGRAGRDPGPCCRCRTAMRGVPRSFRTADPYRIFSRKDGNSWQANIGISLPSFVRKPPGWWSRTHGLSRWWPASSG